MSDSTVEPSLNIDSYPSHHSFQFRSLTFLRCCCCCCSPPQTPTPSGSGWCCSWPASPPGWPSPPCCCVRTRTMAWSRCCFSSFHCRSAPCSWRPCTWWGCWRCSWSSPWSPPSRPPHCLQVLCLVSDRSRRANREVYLQVKSRKASEYWKYIEKQSWIRQLWTYLRKIPCRNDSLKSSPVEL